MIHHRPTGWNTWDFRGFNRLVYLDEGRTRIVVQCAIWDEAVPPPEPDSKQIGRLYDAFRWDDVTRLGEHAPLGLPARLEFQAGGTPYGFEAVERDGTLELMVTPLAATGQRAVFLFVAPVGETAAVESPVLGGFAGCRVAFDGATWPTDYFLNIAEPYAVGAPGRPAAVRVEVDAARAEARGSSKGAVRAEVGAARAEARGPSKGGIRVEVGAARAEARGSSKAAVRVEVGAARAEARGSSDRTSGAGGPPTEEMPTGEGALADAPEAMIRAVAWNTLYDTRRQLVVSPVSRDWCVDWRGVLVFCWDTYLAGVLASYASPRLARLNFEAAGAAIDELGFVPNYTMAHGATSRDRSMPPIGSYMIWKTQCADPDRGWIERAYARLQTWHRFWMKHRDGNGNGLLSWGSNREPHYAFPQLVPYNPTLRHSAAAAKWESGLDNSPMYDDVPFNERTNTLELDDVALSSYYAMDCEMLAAMAARLGLDDEAADHRDEHDAMRRRINDLLWDDAHGIYCNRHWDGRLSDRRSPTSFFPLIAGIAPRDRAERMVREHLLSEQAFWGEQVLPSISRSDPAYRDNDYWRGRIWGPLNFLVAEGLRRYRFDDAAAELARRGLEMFMQNWRADGGVYENYNAETGRGGDVPNAARMYHWGGLLVFIAIQELIDVEPTGYLRVGSVSFPDSAVRNVRIGGDVYDVELGRGLCVRRNGGGFLECTARAIVRIPLLRPADDPLEISTAGPAGLTLHGPEAASRPARLDSGRSIQPAGDPPTYTW